MSRIHAEQRNRIDRERAHIRATLPQPCIRCGRDVDPEDNWDVDHVPALAIDPDAPAYPAHQSCNRSAGATLGNRMRGARRMSAEHPAVIGEQKRRLRDDISNGSNNGLTSGFSAIGQAPLSKPEVAW